MGGTSKGAIVQAVFLLFGNIYAVLPKQENNRPGAGVERAHN